MARAAHWFWETSLKRAFFYSVLLLAIAVGMVSNQAMANDQYRANRNRWERERREQQRQEWQRERRVRKAMHQWDRDHNQRYAHTGRYEERALRLNQHGMTAKRTRTTRSGRQS